MQSIQIVPDLVHFVRVSGNAKTGPIPVSMSQKKTCPLTCPFATHNAGGCYATNGPIHIHWNRLTEGAYGISYQEFYGEIRKLRKGQIWRHSVAGDLKHLGGKLDADSLRELTAANTGREGYSYTHHDVESGPHAAHNREEIKRANAGGFTINLSANSLEQADRYKALGIAPVACVVPVGSPQSFLTPAGHKVVTCPSQTRDNVTCESCGLCAKSQRGCIVGFIPHGAGAKRADAVAKGGA